MPNYMRKVVYLTEQQRIELFANGSITVSGQTIDYNDNDLYVTPTTIADIAEEVRGMYIVPVTGTDPVILCEGNHMYNCGEVATLTITPPASGISNIVFTSGTTPTVLSATGVTWPQWFDPTELEAEMVYEITIEAGRGSVSTWPITL